MKKLGILTLVFNNYGTRLQSWALCKILIKFFGDRLSIDVINVEGSWRNRNQSIFLLLTKIIKSYKWMAFAKILELGQWLYQSRNKGDHAEEKNMRNSLFNRINTLIPYTEQRYSYNDLRSGKLPKYDIIVVGSDQVWNGIKVGNQDIYMLDFLNGQKGLTYAASFGMTSIPKKQKDDYERRINNFSSLLVREDEGVGMCSQLGRNDAQLVLDPTLLLQKDDYLELLSYSTMRINEDYILVYSLNQSYKIYDEAYKLAQKTKCKMIVLKRSFCPPDVESKYHGSTELYAVSPEDFLWLIDNAKCVVTNSYHALLFSIIFRTTFYLYLDNADEENSRLLTVTKRFNLYSHVYMETQSLPIDIYEINYDLPYSLLAVERERSICLLKNSIQNNI